VFPADINDALPGGSLSAQVFSPGSRIVFFFLAVLLAMMLSFAPRLAAQSSGVRFEISFPKEASATPLDGHVLLLISTNDNDEPRFQIAEEFTQSQQAF
jgi:hypothetical protein